LDRIGWGLVDFAQLVCLSLDDSHELPLTMMHHKHNSASTPQRQTANNRTNIEQYNDNRQVTALVTSSYKTAS
jgi:hypothetical protein